MKKLTQGDRYWIDLGLRLLRVELKKDIDQAKAKGKNHLFHENYPDILVDAILDKLNDLTSKRK